MYENRADRLSNNLRLNQISILSYLQFYCKININQLEIVVKATYDLCSNKYFEVLNLTFWGRSLVTRRFGLHSNSRGAGEIKGLLIWRDFRNRNTKLLLLFSIISPWSDIPREYKSNIKGTAIQIEKNTEKWPLRFWKGVLKISHSNLL